MVTEPNWVDIATFTVLTLTLCIIIRYVIDTHKLAKAAQEQVALTRQFEAYPRRLQVYDAIHRFIADIAIEGTTNNEYLIEMLRETKYAKFLFDKKNDITGYVDNLYQKGLKLEYKDKEIRSTRGLSSEQKEKLGEELLDLKRWFRSQPNVIDSKFKEYLQL